MDKTTLLNHPRYGRDPVFFFVEQLVIDTVEGIPSEMKHWIATTIQTGVGGWREKTKTIARLSETFEVAVLDLWYRNSRVAADRGELLSAAEYAQLFVDNYYRDDSQIDVWGPGALEAARERIASEQAREGKDRQ